MYGIIFKGECLTPEERSGLDVFVSVVEPRDDIVANFSPGKDFLDHQGVISETLKCHHMLQIQKQAQPHQQY